MASHSPSDVANNDSYRVAIKDDPELYRAHNTQVQIDNVLFLKRYEPRIKWKQRGDRSIDLGCGDGGMTSTLEKYLPPNYEVLIGCDLNPNMLKFANETYATDRMKFQVLDIEGDIPADWREGFDHVFSFHALHYVRNQERAFRNIYELLAPGGDCLLVFIARHPIYDMYLALSTMDKWSPYLKNMDAFLSPYYYCQEPDKVISDMIEKIGFSSADVRSKQMITDYNTLEPLKNIAYALSPFYNVKELKEQFVADADTAFRGLRLLHQREDGEAVIKCPYNLLVTYAIK